MNELGAVLHPCANLPVAVNDLNGQLTLVATAFIPAGLPVIQITGKLTTAPSRFSVQVGLDRHVDVDDPTLVEAYPERYLWRFLNHRCTPNAFVRGQELVALKPIYAEDEISFNYNANEYQMASPFECWCDAHGGRTGFQVRGYKYLSETEQFAIRHQVSAHVLTLAKEDGPR